MLADLAVLKEWLPDIGWTRVQVTPGAYAVTIRAFRELSPDGSSLTAAGYEFVLDPRSALPPVTANTGAKFRVLNW